MKRVHDLSKGPSCTKITTESEFAMASEFAKAVAKPYGECSEVLGFPKKKETTEVVKYYGFDCFPNDFFCPELCNEKQYKLADCLEDC